MTDIVCDQGFKNCPYRIVDLRKPHPLCNYFRLHARLIINREFSKIPALIRKACEWVQKEEARLECIREIARKRGLDLLKNAQTGDTVYCYVGGYQEVELLNKPKDNSIFVECKASNGKIIRVQACDLGRISKGDYYSSYFIDGNKKKAQELEYRAKYYGFRAKIKKKNNGYLLKLYGDSQQEVEDFIRVVLKQNFELII